MSADLKHLAECTDCGTADVFHPKNPEARGVSDEFKQQCFACGLYGPTRTFRIIEVVDAEAEVVKCTSCGKWTRYECGRVECCGRVDRDPSKTVEHGGTCE